MERMKTLFKYALWVVLFIIFSEFLINVGLNSTYKKIERKDNIEQVNIYQAEATKVNGRIRGIMTNSESEDLSGKYIRIQLFSVRDVFLGEKYIEIHQLEENETQNFELLFKAQDVNYYTVDIVDENPETEELEIIPEEWTKPEIILATVVAMLMFM